MSTSSPWRPDPATAAWAHRLAPEGQPLAFVIHDDGVWAARTPLELVDGLWHAHPDRAHGLLRARILTNQPPSDLDRAVATVCARKLGADVRGVPGPTDERAVHRMEVAAAASRALHTRASARRWPDDPQAFLCPPVDASEPARHRDRAIGALLFDADDRPLLAAVNTNGRHRVRHAELNLLQRWGQPKLPAGAAVWVGTQCCRMCAALLVDAADGPLRVRYLHPEEGPFGRQTALQAAGWEAPLAATQQSFDAAQHSG